jgi:NTP pyrophosphatase (non-canonical NTP hydrolase)
MGCTACAAEEEKRMSERDDLTEQAFHTPTLFDLSPEVAKRQDEHDMERVVQETSTGFDFLLGMQREVERVWGRLVDTEDPEAVSVYVRDVVLCATDELHEVLAEVNWKPWKEKRGIKDIDKYREEMADVLHFILDLYLAAGLNGKDIVLDYMAKHYENLARQRSTEYRNS